MTVGMNEPVTTGMFAAMSGAGSSTTGSDTSAAPAGANMDKDTFLKLLVAQMKYQDPMNPTDSSQFLSQTAQFTSLEKMEDVAKQTAQMVATQMAFGASSLVGRSVSYIDGDGKTVTGTVQAVNFAADGPKLSVDGVPVALAAVQSVTSGAGALGSSTETATDGTSTPDDATDGSGTVA